MYKNLATFMKGCTKVKPHKWICDVKLVRHVGRKKEKKETKGKGHSAKGELKKRNWLKQNLDKLACIYCDLLWRVWKGEGKDEEIKGEAFGHLKEGVKMWSRREKRSLGETRGGARIFCLGGSNFITNILVSSQEKPSHSSINAHTQI